MIGCIYNFCLFCQTAKLLVNVIIVNKELNRFCLIHKMQQQDVLIIFYFVLPFSDCPFDSSPARIRSVELHFCVSLSYCYILTY